MKKDTNLDEIKAISDKLDNLTMIIGKLADAISNDRDKRIQIDVQQALKELSSGKCNQDWIHFFEWNHR